MKLENKPSVGIIIGISFVALSIAPCAAAAQSLGYLSAKPLGSEIARAAPQAPPPVFIVPDAPIPAKVTAPESTAPTEVPVQNAPALNLQPQHNVGPLRARNHTANDIAPQSPVEPQNRGPLKAIYQDSRTALFEGLPNRIASGLPWVNHGNRGEPFESVLARVTTDLQSASAANPEWALPAQNEIRRLAMQLDRLPAPPTYAGAQNPTDDAPPTASNRPFRPRPIWPGASANIEAQTRPTSLTTTGVDEQGSASAGENVIWQNLEPSETPPAPTSRTSRRTRR